MGPRLPADLADALRRGSTLLTANQRAARSLREAFDQSMQAEARELWRPPAVFALDTWMSAQWHNLLLEGSETAILLNRSQEHSLWRAILSSDHEVSGLRSLDSLCDLAARAWHLMQSYGARPRLPEFGVSMDTRAFQRWALEFERRCVRDLYLTSAQLPGSLEASFVRGVLPLPEGGLTLVDFDFVLPAQARLFTRFESSGYTVERLESGGSSGTAGIYKASSERMELQAAAVWARSQLEENPEARIAVVLPEMNARKAELIRVFYEMLAPDPQSITAHSEAARFEFSLGVPLARTAEGAAALDLLRWAIEPLPILSISGLLLSPFFGSPPSHLEDEAEAAARSTFAAADFDACELRQLRLLRPELSLSGFIETLQTSRRRTSLGALFAQLRAMEKTARSEKLSLLTPQQETPVRSHADWANAFRKLLDASGWGRLTRHNSISVQASKRWENALDELATLDFDNSRPTAGKAFTSLLSIATQAIFAPQSQEAPVQIVGPLEVGGVPFDALWFLSANDFSWPSPRALNPLLSWQIQRSFGMPGADVREDAAAAQALTSRISRSAMTVVFSYSHQTDGRECRISPALNGLSVTELPVTPPAPQRQALPVPTFVDQEPLPTLPDRVIRGGAQILELQAACGFRAFAERRLWATSPTLAQPGLDARDRGSDVHTIMEAFWKEVGSQASLRNMALEERHSLLDVCIAQAIARTARRARTPWERAYVEVQQARLRNLLRPWLQIELDRPAFTVLDREKDASGVQIGPLKVDLRVDRVDQTKAGLLILDYKTGPAAPSEWLSDRPDAPQLPLYAVLMSSPDLGGVAFALLRAGRDLRIKGFASDPAVLVRSSNIPAGTLRVQVEEWRNVLTSLAVAFAEGDASVAPKCYPKTCLRCAQRILCRLDVSSLDGVGDDENEFEDDLATAVREPLDEGFIHG